MKLLHDHADVHLSFVRLPGELQLVIHADASFCSEDEKRSRGAFVAMLASRQLSDDGSSMANVWDWSSSRIKRMCRSTLGAELITTGAATDSADWLAVIALELGLLVKTSQDAWPVPIVVNDARSVTSTVMKCTSPKEKNLLIDLKKLRQRSAENSIDFGWVSTGHMVADSLTKYVAKPIALLRCLVENKIVARGRGSES